MSTGGTGSLETRVVRRRLRDVKLLEKNARYMRAPKFKQLVENLKADGCLTSTPLLYAEEVLSGNHRVQAAIKAGIEEAWFMEIVGVLTEGQKTAAVSRERRVAIQLSHNELEGEDDLGILAELYGELPLADKLYSGITDDKFKLEPLDIASLGSPPPEYQEVVLAFLPNEAESFRELVKKFEKQAGRKKQADVHLASLTDFDQFFNSIVRTKALKNVTNTALAIRIMAELAVERLDELEAECQPEDP
jgi:hypothetical protein